MICQHTIEHTVEYVLDHEVNLGMTVTVAAAAEQG